MRLTQVVRVHSPVLQKTHYHSCFSFLFHWETFSLRDGGDFMILFHQENLEAQSQEARSGMTLCQQPLYKHHCQSSNKCYSVFKAVGIPVFLNEEIEAKGDGGTWLRPHNIYIREESGSQPPTIRPWNILGTLPSSHGHSYQRPWNALRYWSFFWNRKENVNSRFSVVKSLSLKRYAHMYNLITTLTKLQLL